MSQHLTTPNREVLEHVFKRSFGSVDKITLTMPNLNKLIEAIRTDERAALVEKQLDAALSTLKGI